MRRLIPLIILVLLSCNCVNAQSDSIEKKIDFNAKKFQYILRTVYNNYANEPDIDKMSEAAFNAALKVLDSKSGYLTAEELHKKKERGEGSQVGIGANITYINDTATIYNVRINSPADSAGLVPGDRIVAIDGETILNADLKDVNSKIAGEKGEEVELLLKRLNGDVEKLSIVRNNFFVPSVKSVVVIPNTKTAFISISRFNKRTVEEFEKAAKQLLKKDVESVILNLRGNPGGYLKEAFQVADEFVSGGSLITYTKARNPRFKYKYTAKQGGVFENLPLIVLIDEQSASGAELVAGAIQDLDRGLIVGEESYGKGSVQKVWNMIDSSGFQMTVAQYYTPLGRRIDRERGSKKAIVDPALELKTGKETYEKVNKAVSELGGKTRLPVFRSAQGRVIIGGGGVKPDYAAAGDTITLLSRVLDEKNIIIEYVYSYVAANYDKLIDKYGDDFERFNESFEVGDSMLEGLKRVSYSKDVWNEDMFVKDKRFIKKMIKAVTANCLFGENEFNTVIETQTDIVRRAIELVPRAKYLIN